MSDTVGGGGLIANLGRIFEARAFDATDVWCEANNDTRLAAAIDAEVPRCRYRSGWKRGELNIRAIRMALRRSKGLRTIRHDGDYYAFRVRAT
jgi:hypothetical protein